MSKNYQNFGRNILKALAKYACVIVANWITDDFSIAPRGVDFFSGSNEDLNSPQKTEKHANSKSWTVCEKPIRIL